MHTMTLILLAAGCARHGATLEPSALKASNQAATAVEAGLVAHPSELTFPDSSFEVPSAADFRHTVGDVPVYVAPSHEFPLVEVKFTFKGGRYLEPDGQWGVAGITADLIRQGGTANIGAEELDERFAYLASDVSVQIGATTATATMNCLRDNLDETLALFVDMLRYPAWDTQKLAISRTNAIEMMKQRNDDAGDIARREGNRLRFGEQHYRGRVATAAMVKGLRWRQLADFHGQIFHPGNLIVSVTGDIEADDVLPLLEDVVAGWEAEDRSTDPPAPTGGASAGLYHVQKDIPQGKFRLSLPGVTRDDPDQIALEVMNEILGGGGFSSRLMERIRSDEGLAYGAYSWLDSGPYFPGTFNAAFDSKNPTVARATDILMEELARLGTEPVADDELIAAKASMIGTFPRKFETRTAIVSTFVDDELTARPGDHWATWRERVQAVTAEQIREVAAKHLVRDKVMMLIVGDWEPIAKGDLEGKANMAPYGEPKRLPLRDPLTQKPME